MGLGFKVAEKTTPAENKAVSHKTINVNKVYLFQTLLRMVKCAERRGSLYVLRWRVS